MFLLDTNVLSELMKSDPHELVVRWIGSQSENPVFTTSIAKAEVLAGIAALPAGRRRQALEVAASSVLANFQGSRPSLRRLCNIGLC